MEVIQLPIAFFEVLLGDTAQVPYPYGVSSSKGVSE
jgi:hypothetical protein